MTEILSSDSREESSFEKAMPEIANQFDPEKAQFERKLKEPFNKVALEQIGRELTSEERALQRGITREGDGKWYQKYYIRSTDGLIFEDDWLEEAPAFDLDANYPELAEKLEHIATNYGMDRFGTSYGRISLKQEILDRIDSLKESSGEKWNAIFKILSKADGRYEDFAQKVLDKNDDKLRNVSENIDLIYSGIDETDERSQQFAQQTAHELAYYYDGNDKNFIKLINDRTRYAIETEDKKGNGYYESDSGKGYLKLTLDSIDYICENDCVQTAEDFFDYIDHISIPSECYPLGDSDMAKIDIFTHFLETRHGMSKTLIRGLEENIYPMVENNDPEVASIRRMNSWAVEIGRYGIADYTIEALTSENTPKNLDKLIRIHNEIPTTEFARFEQNRIDAARLQGSIIGGRDFIHDERPGVHNILSAMLRYYNSQGNEVSRENLEKTIAKYPNYNLKNYAFNLEAYDSVIKGREKNNYGNATNFSEDEKAVDILRRLVENTKPVHLEAPKTKFENLNQALGKIKPLTSEKTGEVKVEISEISDAISAINQILIECQGKIGIMPSTIDAVCYLDKMSAYALRNVGKKQLGDFAYEPTFKEILRFSQLTSSTKYDEQEFESFYNLFIRHCNKAFEADGVDSDKIQDAFRQISQRIMNNSNQLAKEYAKDGRTKRFSDAIWSGNLSHELIGLFDRLS